MKRYTWNFSHHGTMLRPRLRWMVTMVKRTSHLMADVISRRRYLGCWNKISSRTQTHERQRTLTTRPSSLTFLIRFKELAWGLNSSPKTMKRLPSAPAPFAHRIRRFLPRLSYRYKAILLDSQPSSTTRMTMSALLRKKVTLFAMTSLALSRVTA
jgi:hypothetical protein